MSLSGLIDLDFCTAFTTRNLSPRGLVEEIRLPCDFTLLRELDLLPCWLPACCDEGALGCERFVRRL